MKKILLLLFAFASYIITYADRRGTTFEKNGLIYTIASEYVTRNYNIESNIYKDCFGKKQKIDPNAPDTLVYGLHMLKREGNVYVSGITFSDEDSIVMIPSVVYFVFDSKSKDSVSIRKLCRYNVLGIGEKAFEGAKLKDLVIPDGLKFIGDEAFRNMELTNGFLFVPPVGKMKANVFDGVKAKVFLLGDSKYVNTFQNTESLPEFYTFHSNRVALPQGFGYSVGNNIYNEWATDYQKNRLKSESPSLQGDKAKFDTHPKDPEHRGNEKIIVPTFIIKQSKKYEKSGTDLDEFPPYEYECRNPYTGKKDTYQEVIMDYTLFRCRKDTAYYYFTLDGKPITDKESLINDNGCDPFGLQVRSPEEMKAKNAAKKREQNLRDEFYNFKNALGF